jgi:hypothetical protein
MVGRRALPAFRFAPAPTRARAGAAKDRAGLLLVAVADQPPLRLTVQVSQDGAGGDHQPHRAIQVGGDVIGLPLPGCEQKITHRLGLPAPQHLVQLPAELARIHGLPSSNVRVAL